jgi:allantoinase
MADHRSEPQRDFVGYGRHPPDPHWPGQARLALVIVLNIEEGAEPSIGDGDPASETALTDANSGEVPPGTRDLVAETLFEYGSRVGFWRLHDLFAERRVPVTVNACALALERNAEIAAAIREADYDLCCHGWRFARHFLMQEDEERTAIRRAVASLTQTVGRRPLGWQSRYSPSVRTRRLLVEDGGFLYDADSYADDLPYWMEVAGTHHLVCPHTFVNNDNKYVSWRFSAEDFFNHLVTAFTVLHAEGARYPRLMTVSLHCRLSGQPVRFDALRRFLDVVQRYDGVWIAARSDVARHWIATHPAGAAP